MGLQETFDMQLKQTRAEITKLSSQVSKLKQMNTKLVHDPKQESAMSESMAQNCKDLEKKVEALQHRVFQKEDEIVKKQLRDLMVYIDTQQSILTDPKKKDLICGSIELK